MPSKASAYPGAGPGAIFAGADRAGPRSPTSLRSVTALVATSLALLTIAPRLELFWIFWVSICPGSRTTFKILFKSVGEGSRQLNYYGKVYSGLYEFEA